MSAGNVRVMPGTTAPRNGLAPAAGYVWKGAGSEADRRRLDLMYRRNQVPEEFKPYVYGATLGQPSKARPDLVLAAAEAGITEADRRQLAMCRACLADMCETCFGGPCRCACIDLAPVRVVSEASPEAGPREPGRCETCGYLLTAPGHQVSCGTPDASRINRLADSIGTRP